MREEPEANFKKSPKKKNESAREERRKFFLLALSTRSQILSIELSMISI